MSVRQRIPKPLRGPIGFLSLFVMIAGMAIGYVLSLLGVTLYFNMAGIDTNLPPGQAEAVTPVESVIVIAIGIGLIVLGYFGWRGFNYFAY